MQNQQQTARLPFDNLKHGAIEQLKDGRVRLVYERRLSHSIEKVWRAITQPEELERWSPHWHIDQHTGGGFKLWLGEPEGTPNIEGIVESYEPPTLLVLGTMRYELSEIDNGCLLKFSEVLHFDNTHSRKHFALLVLAGWQSHLDKLAAYISGTFTDIQPEMLDYRSIQVPGWEIL